MNRLSKDLTGIGLYVVIKPDRHGVTFIEKSGKRTMYGVKKRQSFSRL